MPTVYDKIVDLSDAVDHLLSKRLLVSYFAVNHAVLLFNPMSCKQIHGPLILNIDNPKIITYLSISRNRTSQSTVILISL